MVRSVLGVAVLVLLAGCAINRSEVDVNVVQPAESQAPAPSNGKKVYISAVDDRVFQIKPDSPDIPTLKYDEIDDKSITERVFARKRNNYNMPIGDVLLPKGQTVSGLVAGAVANAYRQAGYEVVSTSGARDASEVKVHVIEFWSWVKLQGVLDKVVSNKSLLKIKAAGAPEQQVNTLVNENVKVTTNEDWRKITEDGLKAITQETLKQL